MRRVGGFGLALGLFGLLALGAALVTRWAEVRVQGLARPIDGDSLRLGGEEMRLAGLDAPELAQLCWREGRPWRCGLDARAALARELARGEVHCVGARRDRYRRLLVRCAVAGVDLNALLVRSGMAVAFGAYAGEEAEARDARRGIWASAFDRPADWRAAHPRPPRGE